MMEDCGYEFRYSRRHTIYIYNKVIYFIIKCTAGSTYIIEIVVLDVIYKVLVDGIGCVVISGHRSEATLRLVRPLAAEH